MIKYQQQQSLTKSNIASSIIKNRDPPLKNFKQRINQLKAKVKPSLTPFQTELNMNFLQSSKQEGIQHASRTSVLRTNQLFNSTINLFELRNLSERKVIDMRVSYRAGKKKQFQSRQKNEENSIDNHSVNSKSKMSLMHLPDDPKTNKQQGYFKFEENNKENNSNNIQRTGYQIEDILITTYKSPHKTDRSMGSQMKAGQALCRKLALNQKSIQNSELKLKKEQKTKRQKLKNMSHFNLTSNISIDVRQCSARSNTEYSSIGNRKKDQIRKQSDGTGRHLKTIQSATYRIK